MSWQIKVAPPSPGPLLVYEYELPDDFQWADGVDLNSLVVDEIAPLPSPSIVLQDNLAKDVIPYGPRPYGFKIGPKTAEALRAHGVETLGALAALTAPQQEELLASVPRTIVGQLKRMGMHEKNARDDYVKECIKRMNEQREIEFREHEEHFRHCVSVARREYSDLCSLSRSCTRRCGAMTEWRSGQQYFWVD